MKNNALAFLISVTKTAIISIIITGIAYLFGYPILPWFVVTFFGQFILFYFYSGFMEYKAAKENKVLVLKELEILSKITFNIDCAACKKLNEVVINSNIDNRFTCIHCNTLNAVYVSVEAAVVTEPISLKTE